jgi:hypothetical protein
MARGTAPRSRPGAGATSSRALVGASSSSRQVSPHVIHTHSVASSRRWRAVRRTLATTRSCPCLAPSPHFWASALCRCKSSTRPSFGVLTQMTILARLHFVGSFALTCSITCSQHPSIFQFSVLSVVPWTRTVGVFSCVADCTDPTRCWTCDTNDFTVGPLQLVAKVALVELDIDAEGGAPSGPSSACAG